MQVLRAAFALLIGACATTAPDELPEEEMPPDDPVPGTPGTGECAAEELVFERCGSLLDGSYLALADRPEDLAHQVVVIQPATGWTCPIVEVSEIVPIGNVSSLASIGEHVYFCAAPALAERGVLTQVSLVDGAVATGSTMCVSVTAAGGKLVVLPDIGGALQVFDALDDPVPESLSINELGTRLGYGNNRIYSTFSMPASVFIYQPDTRATSRFEMPPNAMQVFGLAGHDETLTLLDGIPDTQYLVTVDLANGGQEAVPISMKTTRLRGLSNTCSGTVIL